MLVVTRKKNQKIVIDNAIEVTVLEVRGRSVKLGLAAPPEVPIRRQELPRHDRSAPQNAWQSPSAAALP